MDEQISPPQTPPVPQTHTSHPLARWLWLSAGFLLVGIGGVGIVVPGLPSTVFFIGAAACFARSNPRFEQWVLNLPRIGPLVRDYRSGLGMSRRAKRGAVIMIILMLSLSSLMVPSWKIALAVWAVGLLGIWYIVKRVPTREHVLAERQHEALASSR